MKISKWILHNPYLLLLTPVILLLMIYFVIPIAWVIRVSFYQNIAGGYMKAAWTVENYKRFLLDFWYIRQVLFFSFKIAIFTTIFSVVLAYPPALYITKSRGVIKQITITASIAPLLISMVSLVFGWMVIFRTNGLLNQFTLWAGITSEPVKYLYNIKGVIICLIYVSVPYIILNLLDSLGRINQSLEEAAMNVGASRLQCFFKIILPLSTPGMFAGSIIVFSLNFCAFAIPLMMGGDRVPMAGVMIYRQAMIINNIPFSAAISVIVLFTTTILLVVYSRLMNKFMFKKLGV